MKRYLEASIKMADGIPDAETGQFYFLAYPCDGPDQAREVVEGLYAAAEGLDCLVSVGGGSRQGELIRFAAVDKTMGMRWIMQAAA